MNTKTLVVALLVAVTLSAPARTEAARAVETSQLLLPAVGLVAGLIAGNIVGARMGIAAFGTAISGKVPGAIIAGLMSAALAAHLAPPTMSLADAILIGVAVTRLAIQVGSTRGRQPLREPRAQYPVNSRPASRRATGSAGVDPCAPHRSGSEGQPQEQQASDDDDRLDQVDQFNNQRSVGAVAWWFGVSCNNGHSWAPSFATENLTLRAPLKARDGARPPAT